MKAFLFGAALVSMIFCARRPLPVAVFCGMGLSMGTEARAWTHLAAPFSLLFLFMAVGSATVLAIPPALRERQRGLSVARFLLAPVIAVAVAAVVITFYMTGAGHGGRHVIPVFHLCLLSAACAVSAAGAGAGLALALQDISLKTKRPPPFGISLPSLADTDIVVYRLTAVTFVLLTAVMISGALAIGHGLNARLDFRIAGALFLWLVYAVGHHLRRIAGWRGFRLGATVVLGFLLFITLGVVSVLWGVGA